MVFKEKRGEINGFWNLLNEGAMGVLLCGISMWEEEKTEEEVEEGTITEQRHREACGHGVRI